MIKIDAGTAQGSITQLADTAMAAEAAGFSGLVTAEAAHDPYLPLMVYAGHTQRVELLTAIAVAFPRSPMTTAYTAWDLQRYSKGRFILGLGTQVKGHNERRFSVTWDRPGPRLKDLILSLHAIWDCWQNGTPLQYEGEFYRFSLMTPFFNPGPHKYPQIPIYIAGVNPYMCRLAGQLCEGFHVHPIHTARYINQVVRPLIAEGAAMSGRDPAEVQLASGCFVVMGDNDEEIAASSMAIKQQIAFYASTRTYHSILKVHGWEDVGAKLSELSRQGAWDRMADEVPDEMLAAMAVIGSRDKIGSLLKDKYDGLLDRISLYLPYSPNSDRDWWQDVVQTVTA
ncbi:MAG: TIGR03617 family F420-dependent LLM class oxidoreductase [Deltaproteobacteria bacterium]